MKKFAYFVLTSVIVAFLTVFVGVSIQTPPTRAEFEVLETRVNDMDVHLKELKDGQKKIIDILIKGEY